MILEEEASESSEPPGFSEQQMVPDMQSEVFGISSAGLLQNAPEKKTGIQFPGHVGIGGGVVVTSLLKQQVPPFGQYLSSLIWSHKRAKRGATQVPSQSSIGREGCVVGGIVLNAVVDRGVV